MGGSLSGCLNPISSFSACWGWSTRRMRGGSSGGTRLWLRATGAPADVRELAAEQGPAHLEVCNLLGAGALLQRLQRSQRQLVRVPLCRHLLPLQNNNGRLGQESADCFRNKIKFEAVLPDRSNRYTTFQTGILRLYSDRDLQNPLYSAKE